MENQEIKIEELRKTCTNIDCPCKKDLECTAGEDMPVVTKEEIIQHISQEKNAHSKTNATHNL